MNRGVTNMRIYAWLLCSLWMAPLLMHAHDSTEIEKPSIATYLRDLEEQGYCVIPNVLADDEVEVLYNRVWHEFIEKAWPKCRLDDRSNWHETFPMHNKMGIFSGPAGQIQPMWDLRQDPRIVDIFAHVWKTEELIVSMDGLSLMCPVEIRESDLAPWPHVDQRAIPGERAPYAPGLNSQLLIAHHADNNVTRQWMEDLVERAEELNSSPEVIALFQTIVPDRGGGCVIS